MEAGRKQALKNRKLMMNKIINESYTENSEDDEDLTYPEPEIDRAYETVDEHFSAPENEDSISSGDEISIPSTNNYRESSSREMRHRNSVLMRGGFLHRNAVHSHVQTHGGAGVLRVSLQDSISWTRSSLRKYLAALIQPSYRPLEHKPSMNGSVTCNGNLTKLVQTEELCDEDCLLSSL